MTSQAQAVDRSSSTPSYTVTKELPFDKVKCVALIALAFFAFSAVLIFTGAVSRHYQWLKMAGAACLILDIGLWTTFMVMPVCCPSHKKTEKLNDEDPMTHATRTDLPFGQVIEEGEQWSEIRQRAKNLKTNSNLTVSDEQFVRSLTLPSACMLYNLPTALARLQEIEAKVNSK